MKKILVCCVAFLVACSSPTGRKTNPTSTSVIAGDTLSISGSSIVTIKRGADTCFDVRLYYFDSLCISVSHDTNIWYDSTLHQHLTTWTVIDTASIVNCIWLEGSPGSSAFWNDTSLVIKNGTWIGVGFYGMASPPCSIYEYGYGVPCLHGVAGCALTVEKDVTITPQTLSDGTNPYDNK